MQAEQRGLYKDPAFPCCKPLNSEPESNGECSHGGLNAHGVCRLSDRENAHSWLGVSERALNMKSFFFFPIGATQEWPGDTLDSDKWLSPSPFILFTIQRLSLNKTLFFHSPCSWLLCLNEPICWRTPPGRSWSLTRTDTWLQHVVAGKNQFLHKRTEICSYISVLATSSKLLWYFLKPWPGGKSQHLFSFNLSISRKCLKTGYNDSDKGEQRTRTECVCYCCFTDRLFILRLMWFLWLELLLDIQGIIFCSRPGWLNGRAWKTKKVSCIISDASWTWLDSMILKVVSNLNHSKIMFKREKK